MRNCLRSFVFVLFVAMLGKTKADGSSFLRTGTSSDSGEGLENDASPTARRLMMECNCPDDFYYTATLQISYHVAPSRSCYSSEITGFQNFLDTKFDVYTAFHEVLGPLDLVRLGSSCRRLRQLGEGDDESEHGEEDVSLGESKNDLAVSLVRRGALPGDSMEEDNNSRRQLLISPNWGFYTGGGNCRFCRPDNRDNRRRLTNNYPITVKIKTDAYPAETGYEITATDGSYIYTSGGFSNAHTEYDKTLYLPSGKQYTFKATDTYGDGFCCSYGSGFAKVYAGTTSSGSPIVTIDTSFGSATSRTFTAGTTGSSSASATTPADAFPALEQSMGNWLTFYMQQAYHVDGNSCLAGTYPMVSVTLTPATQSQALAVC